MLIQFEIILVNLLRYNDSVSMRDIRNYCDSVRKRGQAETGERLYFERDDFVVKRTLYKYSDLLEFSKGRYSFKAPCNFDYFDNRLSKKLKDILEATSKDFRDGKVPKRF